MSEVDDEKHWIDQAFLAFQESKSPLANMVIHSIKGGLSVAHTIYSIKTLSMQVYFDPPFLKGLTYLEAHQKVRLKSI